MSTETVIARYLAIGGAHVTVTRYDEAFEFDGITEEQFAFLVDCDACGRIATESDYNHRSQYNRPIDDPISHARAAAEQAAVPHAETCRRIPERLWAKDGAR